jgi:hypothetical protein
MNSDLSLAAQRGGRYFHSCIAAALTPNRRKSEENFWAQIVDLKWIIGGPDRDRTDDLFHAMEARSQLRHRPTLRKDSIYSGRHGDISQRRRELIAHVPVSNSNRVSEHSAAGGAVSNTFGASHAR